MSPHVICFSAEIEEKFSAQLLIRNSLNKPTHMLIRVIALRLKTRSILGYLQTVLRRLNRLRRCTDRYKSSLGSHALVGNAVSRLKYKESLTAQDVKASVCHSIFHVSIVVWRPQKGKWQTANSADQERGV